MSVFRLFAHPPQWSRLRNNRDAPRFPVRSMVSLVLANGAVVRGHLVDMSVGGALLDTVERPFGLVVGEEGRLGLLVPPGSPESAYQFWCEIVRVSQEGVALRFMSGHAAAQRSNAGAGQMMPDDLLVRM